MGASDRLAIEGGTAVRETMLSYGGSVHGQAECEALAEVINSAWLTTGPFVSRFEESVAKRAGVQFAVAVSSGTAALHAAIASIGIGPGDEVIVPAITFVATANAVLYQQATPVFADIEETTLLVDSTRVEELVTPRTKAVIAVDYAGQPCNYTALRAIAERHGLFLIADACHSFGASLEGVPVGALADLSTLSFHPVKPITSAEGGMVLTNEVRFAEAVKRFRNHCIASDFRDREKMAAHCYDVEGLGFNYRLSDLHCALGCVQLKQIDGFISARRRLANCYNQQLSEVTFVSPLEQRAGGESGYHLYVIRLHCEEIGRSRDEVFRALRAENIGVNVHYLPVYLHSLYQRLGYAQGLCPIAERVYHCILTLPLHCGMNEDDVFDVVRALKKLKK